MHTSIQLIYIKESFLDINSCSLHVALFQCPCRAWHRRAHRKGAIRSKMTRLREPVLVEEQSQPHLT